MGGRLVAEYDRVGSRYLYYTQDQVNSTRLVTDDTGTVVYSEAYNPYGGVQQTWVNSFDPVPKFSGKERDKESDLDYFGARYYDRSQYRFVSPDPKLVLQAAQADPQTWNLYTYCSNSPINYIDPSGKYGFRVHYKWTEKIAIMAGIPAPTARTIALADISRDLPPNSWNKKWHLVSLERYAEALRICETTLDPKEMGKYLHVIQDYFAHSAIVLAGSKHTSDTDDPFSGYSEWNKAMEMAQLTLDLLREFQERVLEAVVQAMPAVSFTCVI
jgi:RHS repeat-associated protein